MTNEQKKTARELLANDVLAQLLSAYCEERSSNLKDGLPRMITNADGPVRIAEARDVAVKIALYDAFVWEMRTYLAEMR